MTDRCDAALQGPASPTGLQPHTTSDIGAAAADYATATGNGTKMELDGENGTVATSDVPDMAQRDDSAKAMPTKAKSFFCGGELQSRLCVRFEGHEGFHLAI